MVGDFRVSEPRRAFVLSVQVLQLIRETDVQLSELLEECDVSRQLHAALAGCDSRRLNPDLQEAVEELRGLMGG